MCTAEPRTLGKRLRDFGVVDPKSSENHGGRLRADRGPGTTFQFTVPVTGGS
jgi:hypothetical protein